MKKTIANTMAELLHQNGRTSIWYGDIELIEKCAEICKLKTTHPKKVIASVLNGLDRSTSFKKSYIYSDFDGKSRKYRCFTLIASKNN